MDKPNIVLVVSDQHRGDWLGRAGSKLVDTPNLDRLAQRGVTFEQAYCSSPLCVPSRMSMMAGREPHQVGVFGNEDILPSGIPTFAHALGLGGYDTVLCGRMHFVGPDQRHGFQHRLVGDITPSYPGGPKTDYAHLARTPGPVKDSIDLAGPGHSPVIDFDDAVIRGYEDFVLERVRAGVQDSLLITVGLYSPHAPFTCPPEEFEKALAAVDAFDEVVAVDDRPHPWVEDQWRKHGLNEVTPEQVRMVRANYAGLINHLDKNIGRIAAVAAELPGDTIFVYVSDHGEMAGDHGLFWKRSFYEPSSRVPMIWNQISQGSRRYVAEGLRMDLPVSLTDIAPTLVALADAPQLPNVDGDNLAPLLAGDPTDSDWTERPVFSQLVDGSTSAIRMVRKGDYKCVYYHGSLSVQLFDVRKDPSELNDLGSDPAYEDVRAQLLELIREGWEADAILSERSLDRHDKGFLREWGRKVGAGRMDLWTETGPFFDSVAAQRAAKLERVGG